MKSKSRRRKKRRYKSSKQYVYVGGTREIPKPRELKLSLEITINTN